MNKLKNDNDKSTINDSMTSTDEFNVDLLDDKIINSELLNKYLEQFEDSCPCYVLGYN
jgi:hypothetical protein